MHNMQRDVELSKTKGLNCDLLKTNVIEGLNRYVYKNKIVK